MTVGGLPLHPLVVHAVVVLLPLAALCTIALAARPVWRQTYGFPVLALAVAGLVAVPIAQESGEDLQAAHGFRSAALDLHIARADAVLLPTVLFVVLLAVAVVGGWQAERGGPVALSRTATVAAVLAAVAGTVVTVLVVLTGDAGATSVWGGRDLR